MYFCFDHARFSVANGHTKPLVFPRIPVLLLTGLAAVENKLATRAGLTTTIWAERKLKKCSLSHLTI
jgi:hypothetical protein